MQFIHLSDLHFHRNKSDNKKATTMLQFVAQNYPAHYLLLTGDITDDGDSTQYERAAEALSVFKGRIFICPGNHDFGAAGMFYEPKRASYFDEKLSIPFAQQGTFAGAIRPVVNLARSGDEQALIIALDSNLETMTPFDFACGEIGELQLQALNEILGAYASAAMTKILLFHHHPFMRNDPFMELKDANRLWATVYLRIDVMLFGHKHVSDKWEDNGGVPFVLAADNSPDKDYAREITVTSAGVSVNDIAIAPAALTARIARPSKRVPVRKRGKKRTA
jgi:3',5'-cyclic AMP phosphodiesterase CpdA